MKKEEIILGKEDEAQIKATLNGDGTATVELATGSVVPWRQHQSSSVYFYDTPLMSTGIIPSDFHSVVPIMRWYYENDAMFGTVIDTMVELAMDNVIKNTTDDKEVQSFFDGIVETSNLRKACRWAMLEYMLLSNVFPYRANHGKKVMARNGKEVPLYEWTVLNPEYTYVEGSMLFDDNHIVLRPNRDVIDLINASAKGIIPEFMPPKISNMLTKGDDVPLDPSEVYHIGRHKQPFQRYAPISLKRVLRPLKMKEIYMRMDVSTANSLINQVIVFKLGNDKFPVTDASVIKKFHELISNNSKAYQLVWTHALEIDYVRADAAALDPKKYEFINQELLYGFAVPPLLAGQSGERGNSNAYLAVKGMVERLTWAREDLEEWLERDFRIIAEENNLKTWPKPKIGAVNLEEEKTFRQILLSLHQHGVLSGETLLDETGFDILTEIERLRIEKEIRDKEGILVPSSPFQKSKNDITSEGVPPTNSPGRPLGSPDEEPRDRRDPNPKPSGSGSISHFSLTTASDEDRAYQTGEIELYHLKLLASYRSLKEELIKIVASSGLDEDLIIAAVLAFYDKITKIGEDTFIRVSDWAYSDSIRPENTSYDEYLDKVISWNDFYANKLSNSIAEQILNLQSIDIDDYPSLVNVILDKEEYRLHMFATEGVKKSRAAGIISNRIDHGYNKVRWVCQFRNSCQVCIDRHDETFSIEDIFEIYPAHNWCECELEFVIERQAGGE